jgi:hypothetical protein
MEPEEENISMMNILGDNVLLTSDNTAIVNSTYRLERDIGGLTVNPYINNDYHIHRTHSDIPNKDGEMVFPELLLNLVKKNNSGIRSILVDSYRNVARFSLTDFDTVPDYLVFLEVKYNWDANNILSPDKLTEYINTSFSMMHTGINFVKFQVKKINIEKRNYEKEFFNMFMKK